MCRSESVPVYCVRQRAFCGAQAAIRAGAAEVGLRAPERRNGRVEPYRRREQLAHLLGRIPRRQPVPRIRRESCRRAQDSQGERASAEGESAESRVEKWREQRPWEQEHARSARSGRQRKVGRGRTERTESGTSQSQTSWACMRRGRAGEEIWCSGGPAFPIAAPRTGLRGLTRLPHEAARLLTPTIRCRAGRQNGSDI